MCLFWGRTGAARRVQAPRPSSAENLEKVVHRPLQRSKPSAFVIAAGRINPSTRASAWPAARTSAPARSIRT
jgi:hypothetical protein